MAGGLTQYAWFGAGDGWTDPGAPGTFCRTPANTPRWFPLDYSMSSSIMSRGAQNRADFSQYHAGVEAESIKAYKQNFQS